MQSILAPLLALAASLPAADVVAESGESDEQAAIAAKILAVEQRRLAAWREVAPEASLAAPPRPTLPPSADSLRRLPQRSADRPPILHLGVIEALPALDGAYFGDDTAASAPSGEAGAGERSDRDRYWNRRRPLPRFLDTLERDFLALPGDLWHDTKNVYGRPAHLIILGAAYGGALALQETGPDDTVERHYDDSHIFARDWRDVFATAGNPGVHFALAGVWYLTGQQTQDEKTYQVARTLFSALAINGLTVTLGQVASSDDAPNGEWGTFPSGHTSSSFCFASVIHEAYGPLAGIPLYGLATLVGFERLDSGEHYFSDVVFGAVMGALIGHSVASGHDPEVFGWKIIPYADPVEGGAGVGLYKTLP